jgi:hypothetical protein
MISVIHPFDALYRFLSSRVILIVRLVTCLSHPRQRLYDENHLRHTGLSVAVDVGQDSGGHDLSP